MKWNKSKTGVPFVSAGRILCSLFDPKMERNNEFNHLVFRIEYPQPVYIGPKHGTMARWSVTIPLGIELKLDRRITKRLTKDEKKFVSEVRNWNRNQDIVIYGKELKWEKE